MRRKTKMPPLNLNLWHYIALIAIAAILMGLGAAIDHHYYVTPIRAELNQQKGADAQSSKDATESAKKTENTQNEQTAQSLEYWKSQAISLGDALSRMRQQPKSQNQHMPSASIGSSGIHEAIGQYGGIGTSKGLSPCFGSSADPCSVERKFYENALDDADLINNGWQDWAKRQHIPIQ